MLGVDRLVARAEMGLGEHMEQLVGTVSADDVRRVQPVKSAKGLAKRGMGAIRIAVEPMSRLAVCLHRMRRRPERRLIRGQFDNRPRARKLGASRNIGVDGKHAGTGLQSLSANH